MPPKKQPNLRRFLKKEIAKFKNKIKHPDPPGSSGHAALTLSNVTAFEHLGAAKVNSDLGSQFAECARGFAMERSAGSTAALKIPRSDSPNVYSTTESTATLCHESIGPSSPKEYSPFATSVRRYGDVNSLFGDQEVESVFGEPLGTARNQEKQAQLDRFLAEASSKPRIPKFVESTELRDLRAELKELVFREADGDLTQREQSLLQRQKDSLIEEFRYMEEAERHAYDECRTAKKREKELRDPIGPFEKKRLEWIRKRLERAKAGAEARILPRLFITSLLILSQRSSKRRHEDLDDSNDIDGEERLRLGKSFRPKPLQMTGHFWSTRHDYFPGLPGAKIVTMESGEKVLLVKTLRDFDLEERQAKRRELAELGAALARMDRRMKR